MKNPLVILVGIITVGALASAFIIVQNPRAADTVMPTFGFSEKRFAEIAEPAGFLNAEPFTLAGLVGKKVILIDFLTYSCINCIRTFPYLNAWYDTYNDQGLEIVGIHTPEFAFEKDIENVREALKKHGIEFPVVLDNDYATWRAYGNNYWPRKYLIDIEGNIVYDHIGEGAYDETEKKIREALAERAEKLGLPAPKSGVLAAKTMPEVERFAQSPEIYFGSDRNERLAEGKRLIAGVQTMEAPETPFANALYLAGSWNIQPEYAESVSKDARIIFRYRAKDVFMVASAESDTEVEVWHDGIRVGSMRGADVSADGVVRIQSEDLYHLIRNVQGEEHTLELRVRGAGLRAFTFTFG